MKKSTHKMFLAIVYIVLGMVVMFVTMYLAIAMFFSGTFLAGHHFIRLALYLVDFSVFRAAIWFWREGAKYLFRHIR